MDTIPLLFERCLDLLSKDSWIMHELAAFICKALKGEVIVFYFEPLITQQMKISSIALIFVKKANYWA